MPFATVDGQTLRLDIFTPAGDTATDRPVMIAFSGGGFTDQERDSVEPIAEDFARRGYVGITADYRVLQTSAFTADELAIAAAKAVHDLFAAVRFVRAEAEGQNTLGVRPDAIVVTGESAGGVMAMMAATLSPGDPVSRQALQDFLEANGGVFGAVGTNTGVSSAVQGAAPLSGAILDLGSVDAQSAVLYAAHEEFDTVVPCNTATEGASFTGLVVSGSCDVVPADTAAGATAELFLVAGSFGHVEFTNAEREQIFAGAASLFLNEVISPGN